MIRFVWASLALFFSTLVFGSVVLVAGLFRVRGDVYSDSTRRWALLVLRASGVRINVEGEENLRPSAGQIVVCNHVSAYDILVLAAVVPGRFAFVGKKELDRIPFFGRAWVAAGHISIDRSNRQKAIATLREAGRRIRDERSTVIIYPEGTRSRTGDLLPFKKGAFALAVESGVPIVPTVITGSNRIVRSGRVHPGAVTIRFGEPVHVVRSGEAGLDSVMRQTQERMREMLYASPDFARLDAGSR